ncbi:hypothetical protein D3C75_1208460 [compost metagenome]
MMLYSGLASILPKPEKVVAIRNSTSGRLFRRTVNWSRKRTLLRATASGSGRRSSFTMLKTTIDTDPVMAAIRSG